MTPPRNLPAASESIDQKDKCESALPEPPVDQANKMIFLVGDDVSLAQDLSLQIGHFGYAVQAFSELAALKAAMSSTLPSVIILGIVFPAGSLDGIEAIKQVRQLCQTPTPVIFVSGRNDLTARLEAVRAGADAYFIKPIDVSELIDAIDRLTTSGKAEPYRVLVVNDDAALAARNVSILEHAGMVARVVTDPMQVLESLNEFAPDLILMDVYMPKCNGLELAAVIRQESDMVGIPIVYLSVETSLEKQMEALRLGGDDFLTQPIEADHLLSSVISRAQRSRILRSLMIRDGLTGLFNHTAIRDRLVAEVARAWRQSGQLACAMIDLDYFKTVNDTYGHVAGDHVLRTLAQVLKKRLRQSDVIGRYGGEEFMVLLTDTGEKGALRVMDEIRTEFALIRHQAPEGMGFSVTLSCGIATFPTFSSANTLTEVADKALYRAKETGRNRVALAE